MRTKTYTEEERHRDINTETEIVLTTEDRGKKVNVSFNRIKICSITQR